jgi:hypothetical protein
MHKNRKKRKINALISLTIQSIKTVHSGKAWFVMLINLVILPMLMQGIYYYRKQRAKELLR